MATHFELAANKRSDVGKGASRRLRRLNDKVPAIVYGAHQPSASIALDHNKVRKALENEAFYSHILTLEVDGQKERVVLKALQRHPSLPRVLHMDFQRVSATEKLTMNVPLHVKGETAAPGVKEGGIVSHHMVTIEISCLPDDLPEHLEVDISHLELNGVIHLSDIPLPKGVEIYALAHGEDHDHSVISIHLPRAAVEEEPAVVADASAVPATEVKDAKEAATKDTKDAKETKDKDAKGKDTKGK